MALLGLFQFKKIFTEVGIEYASTAEVVVASVVLF
jgi:hypothetical protein